MKKLDNKAKTPGGGRYYKIKKISAFTLVELIIVITILVILATIAFLNFGDYGSQARDTVRTTDFKSIEKALELYKIQNGEYPEPDSSSGAESGLNSGKYKGFIEGKISNGVAGKIKFGEIPKDPQTNQEYDYMVSEDKKTYLLKVKLENGNFLAIGDIAESCEDIKKKGLFRGDGNYNIYHNKLEPREIYCRSDQKNTFYNFVLGGDMEPLDGSDINLTKEFAFDFNDNISIVRTSEIPESQNEDLTHKPKGQYSLKVLNTQAFEGKNFTYVDTSKSYRISGKFKVLDTDGRSNAHYYFGFTEYDKDYNILNPARVRIFPGTDSVLTRNLNASDGKIYFSCDLEKYNLYKKAFSYNHSRMNVVAYDTKDDLSDLPTNSYSDTIGRHEQDFSSFIEFFPERGECSLKSLNSFRHNKPVGTKIRLHSDFDSRNYSGIYSVKLEKGKWINILGKTVSGESEHGVEFTKFRKGTKFIKPFFLTAQDCKLIGTSYDCYSKNVQTYIDDVKLEVLN